MRGLTCQLIIMELSFTGGLMHSLVTALLTRLIRHVSILFLGTDRLGDFTDIGPLKRQSGACGNALNDASSEMGAINVSVVS